MADSGPPSTDASGADDGEPADADELTTEELRARVEEKYDFDDFRPADMAEMTRAEWEAAFDPETWITGTELVDRVEADLKRRVADREVFARVRRLPERVVAYSDTGYAVVYPDGSVEGRGTVLRDVKPTVALCSMDSYEVDEPPTDEPLPSPADVPEGSGELGNRMLQAVAAVQLLAGVGLLVAWIAYGLNLIAAIAALGFVLVGVFLLAVVANARLSDRFRAEEYRNRLRAAGVGSGDLPEFLPEETRRALETVDASGAADASGTDGRDGGRDWGAASHTADGSDAPAHARADADADDDADADADADVDADVDDPANPGQRDG